MEKKIGFTIGKFAPLHKGHEFLIETALNEMDEMYVVIYDTDKTNIDIKKRASWINKLYPSVKVLYAYDSPKQYGLDEKSVKIQMNYLSNIIKDIPVTHFYSNEKYGEKVSEYLNIINRNVDIKKNKIPVSGTLLRDNLEDNKKYLEDFIYKEIKIMGRKNEL